VDEKPDFGSTTAVIAYVRRRVTPKVLWSIIVVLVATLVGAITGWVTTQSDISHLKDTVAESKKSVADMQQKLDILQDMKTQLAVIGEKLDSIADEVDRQRGEWDRVHGIAESPPHSRRRSK
jgi:hypothetical protein